MTISKVTTERLKQIVSGNAFTCTQDDESAAMADELLAVREAKPVAWTDREELAFVNDMACMWTKGMGINEVPLYTAPPAPAVIDFGALTKLIVGRLIDCGTASDDSIADAEVFVYNACRAAMLAAAPTPTNQGADGND